MQRLGLALVPFVLWQGALAAQSFSPLSFKPLDSDYSVAVDRLILLTANPSQVHLYNPATNADQTITLNDTPTGMSLSPDGTHLAVAHASSVSYVNLQTSAVEKVFSAQVNNSTIVLGTQYVYVMKANAPANPVSLAINLASSQVTQGVAYPGTTPAKGRYNTLTNAIYDFDGFVYDASTGPITAVASQYNGGCPVWFSTDQTRYYDGCGSIRHISADKTVDRTYLTTMPYAMHPQAMAFSSALRQVAVVPRTAQYDVNEPTSYDNEIRLLSDDYYNLVGHFAMPDFQVGGKNYRADGRAVFYNKTSTALYVLVQADYYANLTNDYALLSIPLSNANCSLSLTANGANITGAGTIDTVSLAAGSYCPFQASANVSWIQFPDGTYSSNNRALTYQVRPNDTGAQRTGTISLGSASFTVAQAAHGLSPLQNPLSFKVVAADYSKSLDKIVMVSAIPNEVHIYDGASETDRLVPLAARPLSVSVGPDGTYAAVGHDGWVSYVNLQTAAVEKFLTVPDAAPSIVLAGNGYAYAFSKSQVASLQISNGQVARNSPLGSTSGPVRLTPSGKYIYTLSTKWDVSAGPIASTSAAWNDYYCENLWLSEDGNRAYDGCGSVRRASEIASLDWTQNGSFSGVNPGYGSRVITWVANSATQQKTAVLTGTLLGTAAGDSNSLQIYADSALSLLSQQTLPSFAANGGYFDGHGRYAFWSRDAQKIFVLEQADSASSLAADFAVVAVDQTPNPAGCTFSVSGGGNLIAGGGGSTTFTVTASAPNCKWTSFVGFIYWLSVNSGAAGTGSGTVTIGAVPNDIVPSARRTATLTIAGQTVTVTQDVPCTYTVSPSSALFFSNGGSGSLNVATAAGCPWTARTSNSSITLTSSTKGTGNGTVSYSVAPNTTGNNAYTTITVGLSGFNYTSGITVLSAAAPPPLGPLRFVPLTPCRVADTRNLTGTFGGPILKARSSRDFPITGSGCGVPATAQAYALNVTVVPPSGLGYLTVWPAGLAMPSTSNLNSDGRVKAAAVLVAAGTSGAVSVYASNDTQVILDINGYFVPATDPAALAFYPTTPCRVIDTRVAGQGPALAAGQTRTVAMTAGACGLPAGARAYSANFTVVPRGGLGYLSSWPTGQPQPVVSTLNATNAVTANAAIVPAGANGAISVYASDATDLIVDVNGYFAPAASGGLSFYAMPPCRLADSRSFAGGVWRYPMIYFASLIVGQTGCIVPNESQALVINTTVVPYGGLGFLSVWGYLQPQPVVSTLNSDGTVNSNLAITPITNGGLSFYLSDLTDVIVDFSGYFAP